MQMEQSVPKRRHIKFRSRGITQKKEYKAIHMCDNIKMDLQEVECWDMDWINLAKDRDRWRALVNVVMNLRVP